MALNIHVFAAIQSGISVDKNVIQLFKCFNDTHFSSGYNDVCVFIKIFPYGINQQRLVRFYRGAVCIYGNKDIII
jgi:hypothetical protein